MICGRNATRIQLNLAMKRAAGFAARLPHRRGALRHAEKIICLKNRADLGIVNGMFLRLEDVEDENELCFSRPHRSPRTRPPVRPPPAMAGT